VNNPALVKHSRHCPTKLASQTLKCYHLSRGTSLWAPLSSHVWQESLIATMVYSQDEAQIVCSETKG